MLDARMMSLCVLFVATAAWAEPTGGEETSPSGAAPTEVCRIAGPEALYALELAALPGHGTPLFVRTDGTLNLTLRSMSPHDGEAVVAVESRDERGGGQREIGTTFLEAGSSVVLPLGGRALGLTAQPLSFSGVVTFTATIRYATGITVRASRLQLSFHPVDGGWLLYDSETRESSYDGGALTAPARAIRRQALARAPADTGMVSVGWTVVEEARPPDSALSSDEGPPDPDRSIDAR